MFKVALPKLMPHAIKNEEFRRRAPTYERASPWVKNPVVLNEALALCKSLTIKRIVDLGGGTGALSRYLAEQLGITEVVLVDRSSDMLAQAPQHFLRLHEDVRHFLKHYHDSGHTLWLLRQVLHYVRDPVELLSTLMAKSSRSSCVYAGQIVAPNPNYSELLFKLIKARGTSRQRFPNPHEFLGWFERTGYGRSAMSMHPWTDDLADWLSRSLEFETKGHQIAAVERAMNDASQTVFFFENGRLRFRTFFLHCLFHFGDDKPIFRGGQPAHETALLN